MERPLKDSMASSLSRHESLLGGKREAELEKACTGTELDGDLRGGNGENCC